MLKTQFILTNFRQWFIEKQNQQHQFYLESLK